MQIRPYLTFRGECQEAIELYKRAFGTEVLEIARFSDMPPTPDSPMEIPDSQKNWILQATMRFGDNFIRLSDCPEGLIDPPSERVAISVECSIDEVKHAFAVLSEEGRVGIPLQQTFFSPCHGVVHDKFGVMWLFVALAENQ